MKSSKHIVLTVILFLPILVFAVDEIKKIDESKKNNEASTETNAKKDKKNKKDEKDRKEKILTANYLDGSLFDLREVAKRNKLTVVNFWETWCAPCKVELPDFEKIYQTYKGKDVAFIGIEHLSPQKSVQPFLNELKITFPTVFDEKSVITRYFNVIGTPTTVVLDSKMNILRRVEGVDTALATFIAAEVKK